jgi:hypothetical protein
VFRPPATNDPGDCQHIIKRGPHQHDKLAIEFVAWRGSLS